MIWQLMSFLNLVDTLSESRLLKMYLSYGVQESVNILEW